MFIALKTLNACLILFTLLYTFYLVWQVMAWLKTPSLKPGASNFKTRVSVIIPVRNEAQNIGLCLQTIMQQDYPAGLFEIIVADDHSDDATCKVTENTLKGKSFSWQCVPLQSGESTKKKAIEVAIKASSGELIVITDADCAVQKKMAFINSAFI